MAYIIDQEKCEKDDHCLEACPVEAIEKKENGSLVVKVDECTDCGACELVCDVAAIHSTE
jgi:NAD-dependent dihydropyrimidine dehydrogenase PreA subunit